MSHVPDARLVPLRDSLAGLVLRGTGGTTYHLRECIGEGGQGWVFRANWDDPSGHVVIVKVLRPDVVGAEVLLRFEREAEVLRMLSTQGRPNPYIVRFFDHAVAQVPSPFGPEPLTLPFTVLEYVNGTTLERVLDDANGRGLPAPRIRRLVRQISQALEVVHAQKVVHRDLKPSNILLANEAGVEVAKVTDFGLVKLVDMNMQRTTALAGASLGYAPPEQYEQGNQRVSPRTDVFSLAAVTFEMLTGKRAFPFNDGENPLLIVTRILTGPRPSVLKHRATLAPELERHVTLVEALDKALTKAFAADPSNRHESAMDLWNAIEPALRTASDEADSVAPKRKLSAWEVTELMPRGGPASPHVTPEPARLRAASSPPGPLGPPEAVAADPQSWSWSTVTGPLTSLRAAAWSESGDVAIAFGLASVLIWHAGGWRPIAYPRGVNAAAVRGVRFFADGSALVFGEHALVARFVPGGHVQTWSVPDPEITFHGGWIEESGITTLVGERPFRGAARAVPGATAGVVVQFSGDRVTVVGDAVNSARLRDVTRIPSGPLVACGDWGAIVRVEMGVVEQVGSICHGHLIAIRHTADGGALTVGVGGHALSLSAELDAQLEAVQTTRDLLSLATSPDGQWWAGSGSARIVRRSAGGWLRMTPDLGMSPNMIAMWAAAQTVRAVGDDGVVVEGRLELPSP